MAITECEFRLRLALRAVLTATVLGAAFLLALVEPAATQNVVSDLPLAGGGIERVVFTSPANPTAILVMFAGGDGTVEIADSATMCVRVVTIFHPDGRIRSESQTSFAITQQ